MNGFAAAFSALSDPRRPNARLHKLLDILAIAFCACLCGAESCVDMAEFAQAKEDVLREFLTLEGGPPSHDTFSRVFRAARSGGLCRLLSGVARATGCSLPGAHCDRGQDLAGRPRPSRGSLTAANSERLRVRNPADLGAGRR